MLVSFSVARRIRPIYRAMRKDNQKWTRGSARRLAAFASCGRFRRELRETSEYLVGRHTILRKELFAHRRELVLWTSWGFLIASINVVIMWFGGYLAIQGGATDRRHHGVSVVHILAAESGLADRQFVFRIAAVTGRHGTCVRSPGIYRRTSRIAPDAGDAARAVARIRFENVWFEYTPGRPVVQDFDVTVPGGPSWRWWDAAEPARRR